MTLTRDMFRLHFKAVGARSFTGGSRISENVEQAVGCPGMFLGGQTRPKGPLMR